MEAKPNRTLALLGLALLAGAQLTAQPRPPRFKIGDRVEVDTLSTSPQSDPSKSLYWRKGTVTGYYNPEEQFGGYLIKLDDRREWRTRFVDTYWIRPASGDNAPAPADTATDQGSTVACPPMDNFQGTSQDAIFRRIIADRYHRNGKSRDRNLSGVTISVHFTSFKIGATHPYRRVVANPDGDGAVDGTTVYPVKTTYHVCADYPGFAPTGNRGELLKTDYEDMTYSCFKDATGDWICNQTGGDISRPERVRK